MDAPAGTPVLTRDLLDPTMPTPLYHQIYLVLRERIRSGEFPANAVLPGEQELAKLFEVSRITVKRAMNELAANDLVTRHRGRGTVVSASASLPVVNGSFDNLIESLTTLGLETQVEVLEVQDVPATAAVATLLDVETGTVVQRASRLRKLQGEPFSYLIQYVPLDVAARISREDMGSVPMLMLLERAGAAAMEAEQWFTAVAADPAMGAALQVGPGAPLLRIERVMRDRTGRAVQVIYAHYRPDRFKYHMRASRRPGGASWASES